MKTDALLGIWTGTVHHSNGWDMKITLSVMQPFEIGSILGIFDIPLIQCSGSLRLIAIQNETLELRAIKQQGDCPDSESESLELLLDGTLLYTSKGKGWETKGILYRNN
jgi:hypothetical protein